MFVGKYYNSIDSKSRIIVPAKFRDELEGRCIIAKALDRCLTIILKISGRNSWRRSWISFRQEILRQES